MSELSVNAVRAVFKCAEEDKKEFHTSNCSLTISVGQPYHEGNKFLATINLVNKSFQKCFINVCDTLQRHTIALDNNITLEAAWYLSSQFGDEWIERNKEILNKLNIPHEFIRWNHWLSHLDYQKNLALIEKLYQSNAYFHEKVKIAADLYLERYKKRTNKDENFYALMYNASLDYLKEECAVMLLWEGAGYNFEIYPSERNEALGFLHERFIKPYQARVLNPIYLKFK